MNTLLIGMVCIAFLTAILTAGKESRYGVKEEDLNK